MYKLFARCRGVVVASVAAVGVAACGGGGGTLEPEVLTPEQVAGNYRICELTFTPEGGLPEPANIVAMMDTAGAVSRLEVAGGQRQFTLMYRLNDGTTTQTVTGSYATGSQHVDLPLGSDVRARRLLLPERLRLAFDPQARTFTVSAEQAAYEVAKSDYELLTRRQLAPAIRDRFSGRLSARFVDQATPCS